jgi:predicted transcriptional regulator YdeE
MNYEVVYLKEKIVAGIKIRTNNNDPNMKSDIGKAWQGFFEEGTYQSILHKKNNNTIGLYTNYENKVNGDYDLMICCEVFDEKNLLKGVEIKKIEEGKYAKFVKRGKQEKAVAECWEEIWATNLDRKYSFDFEEYKGDCQSDNVEISIYIAIN